MTKTTLEDLRGQLTDCDDEIIKLIALRQSLVNKIGRCKRDTGRPTRDYRRETIVFENARRAAQCYGVDPDVAHAVLARLIRYSLSRQENLRAQALAQGVGRRALIIGGLGKMGRWFAGFLENQQYSVELADPGQSPSRFANHGDWKALDLHGYDLILVATPLDTTRQTLLALAEVQPRGIVMDIASVKSPLKPAYARLLARGCKVVGIHPMFGPDARLLADKHLLVVDTGCESAKTMAMELFAPTMVRVVSMDLAQHDRQIAWLLGLSHALNICFLTALAASGRRASELADSSSTTFEAQLEIATGVARESAALYFEIQHANPYNSTAIAALQQAIGTLGETLAKHDREAFIALMHGARDYLAEHAQAKSRHKQTAT